jgi:hypothetical protein
MVFNNANVFLKQSIVTLVCIAVLLYTPSAAAQSEATSTSEEASSSSAVIPVQTTAATSSASSTETTVEATPTPTPRRDLTNVRQQALDTVRQQRVINLSANISNRMEAVIERLTNIIDRLETRMSTLRATGVNTTAAEAELQNAALKLANARQLLSTIDIDVYGAATAANPYTTWLTVRSKYQNAGSEVRAAYQSLRTIIALLRQPNLSTPTATSTIPTSDPLLAE